MVKHHQGAVTMAQTGIARGENAEARELAESIITTQKAEIVEMLQLHGLERRPLDPAALRSAPGARWSSAVAQSAGSASTAMAAISAAKVP